MGVFSNKEKNISVTLLTEDVPFIAKGNAVKCTALDNESKLEIKMPFAKKEAPTVSLNYSQIVAIERISDVQIKTIVKQKSVIGRAITGGLLLGPLGATVGAISGVGEKQKIKNEYNFYVIINYQSSTGEPNVLSFKEPPATMGIGVNKFVKHIKEVAKIKDVVLPTEVIL